MLALVCSRLCRRVAEGFVCFIARRWPQPLITYGRGRERRRGEGGSGVGDKGGRKKVRGVCRGSKKRVVTSGWGEAGMNGGGLYEA